MDCSRIDFSSHAVRQMFGRGLSSDDIVGVVQSGQCIKDYPDDSPYPSSLLLGWIRGAAVHVVVARDPAQGVCIVVTAYQPDPSLWTDDYERRRDP